MINEESLQIVDASLMSERFVKPIYDTYGFGQIPATVKALLTGESGGLPARTFAHLPRHYDKVILIFADAFGWRFVQRCYDKYPFLQRILSEGVINKITSQFPSTTAAHTTTIHTGLPVGESGIYEWFLYEPTLDAMIMPLMFSFAGDRGRDTLRTEAVNPKTLYPRQTLYQDLKKAGIKSYAFQHRDYTPSAFSDVVLDGAHVVPYLTLPEALTNLTQIALEEKQRSYYYLYFAGIDTMSHLYGPDSPQVAAEIDLFLVAMERLFHKVISGKINNCVVLVTADHGQIEVSPETTIYLNTTLPSLEAYLKRNHKGQLLVPAGSPRDMFLHIKPECMDDAYTSLRRHLGGRAEVYRVRELAEQGFFGPRLSETFLARVGDLVILPYAHHTVWWYEKNRYEMKFLGHHGGLDREEMETILLVQPYL